MLIVSAFSQLALSVRRLAQTKHGRTLRQQHMPYAKQIAGGVEPSHEDGETVRLAKVTQDFTGDEAHTHRDEVRIDVGDARMTSEAANDYRRQAA